MVELKQQWREMRRQQPMARARDFARERGVTEAELVDAFCGDGTVRLAAEWPRILEALPSLGRVMALTRNEYAVHERKGSYHAPQFFGPMGQVVGEEIDLRLFPNQWKFGFAITEETPDGSRRSLQFFDRHGVAVHKVFLLPESDVSAFDNLVESFTHADQTAALDIVRTQTKPSAPENNITVDASAFQAAWDGLQDTHDFFGLLRKFNLSRTLALRTARPDQASQVGVSSLSFMLHEVSATQLPIMVFVGNDGVIQIHTGNVTKIVKQGPWINVLDEDFNLHVREDLIHEAWLVRKPTRDGVVTSLELFAADGEQIALLFGKRKPGQAESEAWRALAGRFPQ